MESSALVRGLRPVLVGIVAAGLIATSGVAPVASAAPIVAPQSWTLPVEDGGGEADPSPVQSATPIIVGEPIVGGSLAVEPGAWEEGTAFGYQWLADGVELEAATGPELAVTAAEHGKRISVRVTGTKDERTDVTEESAPTLRVAHLERPGVAGVPVVGATLTAEVVVAPGATATYQWSAGGVPIPGAVEAQLVVPSAAEGQAVSVRVTQSQDEYATVSRSSAETLRVLRSATPVISGKAAVGETLTASAGDWSEGTTVSFAWYADGVRIGTGSNLTVTSARVGTRIHVVATGTKDGHGTDSVESLPTSRVATVGKVTITGTATIGSTLTTVPGSWTAGTGFSYQWRADGVPIAGASAKTFTVGSAQAGKAITVAVTGTLSGYQTMTRTSSPTSKVLARSTPTISGTAAVGFTLTAKPNAWTSGTSFSYAWLADGKAVKGATRSTFKIPSSLKAKRLSVRVTGVRSGYQKVTLTSASTAKVALSATPRISGSAVVGSTLTAKPGTWTGGTSYRYQWYVDGRTIKGATKSSLKLSSSRMDGRLTVKVTGRKSGYTTLTRESARTARVQQAPTPGLSGSAKVTYRVSVKRGTWSKGTTFSYKWYAAGKAITGANSSSLRLSSKHVGKRITVKVTGRKTGYPTVTRTSKASKTVSYPNRTDPVSEWNCPSWAPIKGNANSGIYHVPSGAFYDRTKPEECFRTESAARSAGYRKSKV